MGPDPAAAVPPRAARRARRLHPPGRHRAPPQVRLPRGGGGGRDEGVGGDAGAGVRLRPRAHGGHYAHALRHRAALQDRRLRRVQEHPRHNDVVPRFYWHSAQVHAEGCGGFPCETSEKE